jgi:hypothetical protein
MGKEREERRPAMDICVAYWSRDAVSRVMAVTSPSTKKKPRHVLMPVQGDRHPGCQEDPHLLPKLSAIPPISLEGQILLDFFGESLVSDVGTL